MSNVDFAAMQRILTSAGALTDAPEAHGTLAGAFCAGDDYAFEQWLGELFAEGRADEDSAEQLRAIFDDTRAALQTRDHGFNAMLPDDEQPISERATALGQWCQGFLYGLGSSPIRDLEQLPGNIGEIVRDFTTLTQVGVNEADGLEDNESAYAELVEFVRVGAQLLFEELSPYRSAAPAAAPGAPLH